MPISEEKFLNKATVQEKKNQVELSGLVLCGGRSTRMGADKGLLSHNGKSWAKNIADLIRENLSDVFISIRTDQTEAYQKFFNLSEMIFDQDDLSIMGPLKGLLSAHKLYPEKNWLVISCDMIQVNQKIITGLKNAIVNNPGYHYYLYKNKGILEPLCAVYINNGLRDIYRSIPGVSDFSLQRNLPMNKCFILEAEKENTAAFKNFNQREDLETNSRI